jgi:hypothetical protein
MDTVKVHFKRAPLWKYIEPIVPAIQALPKWYKDMKPDIAGMKPSERHNNGTVKACPAMFDSMAQGYIMPLWTDLYVEPSEEGVPFFSWNPGITGGGDAPLMQRFDLEVTQGMPNADRTQAPAFKIDSPWIITTPPGYSMLFVPPFNNRDIMFESIAGVVNTDVFTVYMNLPFLWTGPADFKGIIKQGTPLVQMIPFKREKLEHEIGFISPEQEDEQRACTHAARTGFGGGYRKLCGI